MIEPKRRAVLLVGAASFAFPFITPLAQAQASDRPLVVGVLPITTTRVLLKNYQLFQTYLERELGRSIELVTASDFRTFQKNTLEGQYDVLVTAPHLGRQAQLDVGYQPLARYSAVHRTLLLFARDRPVKSVEELRGKTLAGPDLLTLASIEAQSWLRARGLRAGSDFTIIETPSPPSAAQAMLNRQAILTISTPQGWNNTPENLREQMEVFATLPEMPSQMWLAHPRIGTLTPRVKQALLGFTSLTNEGKAFFDATGYIGLREVQPAELKAAEAYLPVLREHFKVKQ